MDPRPPVSSARSKPADVVPGRFAASPPLRKPRGASSAPHTHVPEQIRETGLLEAGLSGSSAPRGHIGLPGAVSVGVSALRGAVPSSPPRGLHPGAPSPTLTPTLPTARPSSPAHWGSPRRPATLSHFFPSWVWQALGWNCPRDAPSTYQAPAENLPSGQRDLFSSDF